MTELCVCVCVDPWSWSLCVCVCVCEKKFLVVISLQRICRIPCRKEESVSVRFLTGNRKKNYAFKKFCSTAWGTVTRIEPGNDCKKNFTCIGRRHLIDVFQKKKEQFLWDVNRMVEQSKLCCLTMAKLLLYGRWPNRLILKGRLDAPLFEFGFCFNWRARRTLIPCEGPIVTFNRLWLFHLF